MPSGLGGRLIIVVRQADENLAFNKNFNFNLKACLGCFNGFMALIASYQ